MDIDWALAEIEGFLALTEFHRPPPQPGVINATGRMNTRGTNSEIVAAAQVVEQIFDRVLKDWRRTVPDKANERVNRWYQHRETALRVRSALQRQEEIREKLGDNAPRLNAAHLHPWIWEGARSLWSSGHYREAVRVAAVKLNAETQNKLGRMDVSEISLFRQAFTAEPPQAGKPRLRVMDDDGSPTFASLHRGIMSYAEGCYAAIRNPTSHIIQDEISEDHALEQLAAFSVLARWVDSAKLVRAA